MKLILKALAAAVALAVFVAGLLVVFADLRLELAGSGLLPIVSFGAADEHFDALDLNPLPALLAVVAGRPAARGGSTRRRRRCGAPRRRLLDRLPGSPGGTAGTHRRPS